jgi:RNA polymerase sigma-70 factor (ECF subfamily)
MSSVPAHAPLVDPLDDAVQRMCRGDGDAFRVVYHAVHPTLLRYLEILVGADDAEDVGSETWAQACRDLGRFHEGGGDGFRAWVTTIGRHRALDHLRRRGRGVRAVQDLTGVEVVDSRDAETAVLETYSTAGAVALVAGLPRDQAEAVWLRAVMDLDVRTVAEMTGKRPGAVRSATHRGLRSLARRLGTRPDFLPAERDVLLPRGAEGVR